MPLEYLVILLLLVMVSRMSKGKPEPGNHTMSDSVAEELSEPKDVNDYLRQRYGV
jgi:hypothetical protein